MWASLMLSGWALTIVIGLIYRVNIWMWFHVVCNAVASLFLISNPKFPRRAEGLMGSWVGAFIAVLWWLAYDTATSNIPVITKYDVLRDVAGFIAISGLAGATMLSWLFVGYGLIQVYAMIAAVVPARWRDLFYGVADTYPFPFSPLSPLPILLVACLMLVAVNFFIRSIHL